MGWGELRYEVISKFIFVLKHAITLESTWGPTSTAHVIAEDRHEEGRPTTQDHKDERRLSRD